QDRRVHHHDITHGSKRRQPGDHLASNRAAALLDLEKIRECFHREQSRCPYATKSTIATAPPPARITFDPAVALFCHPGPLVRVVTAPRPARVELELTCPVLSSRGGRQSDVGPAVLLPSRTRCYNSAVVLETS